MKIITATYGQTLMDIAVQEYGCYEGVTLLMQDNDLALTANLVAGQELLIRDAVPELTATNQAVAQYNRLNGISVNSGNDAASSSNNGYVTEGYVTDGYVS